jgi:hypothetical protein
MFRVQSAVQHLVPPTRAAVMATLVGIMLGTTVPAPYLQQAALALRALTLGQSPS